MVSGSIVTIGEILVEIMAVTPGRGFFEPIDLVGPFPSGAPAIFIDQVARQGHGAAMIGCVGDDDFGRVNITRLRHSGVDVSAIRIHPDAVTGSAFVRYRPDGQRDFVFNIRHSANAHVMLDDRAMRVLEDASHLHVVGSSMASPAIADAIDTAIGIIKTKGGTVSFDPNVRKELLAASGVRDRLARVLARSDLFLPSGDELLLLSDEGSVDAAIAELLGRGISAIVHKNGALGSRYIDAHTDFSFPAYAVEEVDPTGAGDIFGATFVAGWLSGAAPEENLRRANAAGAIAVTRKGPMEGAKRPADIDAFIANTRTRPAI